MNHAFTIERLTVGDISTLMQPPVPNNVLIDIMARAYNGDLRALPFTEFRPVLDAFFEQLKATLEEDPIPPPPNMNDIRAFMRLLDELGF